MRYEICVDGEDIVRGENTQNNNNNEEKCI
jgi:hypothetical protein